MEAIPNFRDFGGYKTSDGLAIKKGLLFRSGSLARATEGDLQRLAALGIRTVCDLRTVQERRQGPDRLPGGRDINYVHIPIKARRHNEAGPARQLWSLLFGSARGLDYSELLTEFYQELVTDFSPDLGRVIRLVSDRDNLPLLIHCTAGKDRTGVTCGLIQLLLGLPAERVMADYLLSNNGLDLFKAEMRRKFRLFLLAGLPGERFVPLMEARPEYLLAALAQIEASYGGLDDYARRGLGLSDEDRLGLKGLFLEGVSPPGPPEGGEKRGVPPVGGLGGPVSLENNQLKKGEAQ